MCNTSRADQRAELHECLVVRPRCPTRPGENRLGNLPEPTMPFCAFRVDRRREHASQHARDIRVDQRRASLIGERGHSARRICSDARQGAKRLRVCRKLTFRAPAFGDLDRKTMEVARSRIVAETFPRLGDASGWRARHVAEGRELAEKLAVFRDDSRDLRLLEHQLRHEHLVRAASPAPRQVARVSAVPGTKPATEVVAQYWVDRQFALSTHRDQSIAVNTRIRFNAAVAGIALAVLITPALLFAHARLVRSNPAVNAVISSPPVSLSLWFSERPELRFTSIELVDSAGAVIPHGPMSSIDSMGVTAAIGATLTPGRYSVAWRTAAADAHGTSGRFSFVVVADTTVSVAPVIRRDTISITRVGTGANSPIQSGGPSGFSSAVRWAEFVALITLIGAVVFRLLALPAAEWPDKALSDAADRTRRLATAVLLLFAIAAAMRLRAAFEMMPTTAFTGPNASGVGGLMSGEWGIGWLIAFAGALIVAVGVLVARRSTAGWLLAAFGLVPICLGEALTGHAGSMPRFVGLSVAADVAHVLGAGGWIGGLACLVMCGIPALATVDPVLRDVAAARLVRAYHRAAIQCVVLVAGSGLVAAWLRLGAFSDLWTTDYGSMLFRKLVFVIVVLGFGFYHWRTAVIPEWNAKTANSFRRTAVIELIVGAVVLAFTALLVSTALPNHP